MILIADSGSTKTEWAVIGGKAPGSSKPDGGDGTVVLRTQGINPFHQTPETIRGILADELLPALQEREITNVYFYGSGVRPEVEPRMEALLREMFPAASVIEAHSDLLGAARALCGRNEGIACILGTGANSCLYDGNTIVSNTPPLGYILGDEGSGAVLGSHFLRALLRGELSEKITADFCAEFNLSTADILDRVYRRPLPNRFLASFCPFISSHLDDASLSAIVTGCFTDFFRHHIAPYHRPDLPISFVGSVAFHFRAPLTAAAASLGFCVGSIVQSPLQGLQRYHK